MTKTLKDVVDRLAFLPQRASIHQYDEDKCYQEVVEELKKVLLVLGHKQNEKCFKALMDNDPRKTGITDPNAVLGAGLIVHDIDWEKILEK